jgi:hypothetical protein
LDYKSSNPGGDENLNQANKLSRTYATLIDALKGGRGRRFPSLATLIDVTTVSGVLLRGTPPRTRSWIASSRTQLEGAKQRGRYLTRGDLPLTVAGERHAAANRRARVRVSQPSTPDPPGVQSDTPHGKGPTPVPRVGGSPFAAFDSDRGTA